MPARIPYPTQQPSETTTPADTTPKEKSRIYITGKVVLDDGTPPPDFATIERVCDGVVRPEGYTDSKGRFSVQLGQNSYAFADARLGSTDPTAFDAQAGSVGGQFGLMGCVIRGSLAGFRSDEVSLAGRRAFDRPDIGTIVLHRNVNVPGTTISLTSLAAPKDAVKAFDKGREAIQKEKWADARKQIEKAVESHPTYAAAWYELGRTLEHLNDESGARRAYQQALSADERYLPPCIQLANMAARAGDWVELVARTDQVLKLDPVNLPGIYLYNSIGQFNVKNLAAAERSAREALRLDTAHAFPDANRILGVILARRGDLDGAAEYLKIYLKSAPSGPTAQLAREQLASVEQLAKAKPSNQH
jgi:tetratricopeptide (TPR) repeat protein